jgi:hypothetical protein
VRRDRLAGRDRRFVLVDDGEAVLTAMHHGHVECHRISTVRWTCVTPRPNGLPGTRAAPRRRIGDRCARRLDDDARPRRVPEAIRAGVGRSESPLEVVTRCAHHALSPAGSRAGEGSWS